MTKEQINTTSFMKGWRQVPQGLVKEVRNELKAVFGIYSEPPWRYRLQGKKELTVSEAESVIEVFKKYGITNIWGK